MVVLEKWLKDNDTPLKTQLLESLTKTIVGTTASRVVIERAKEQLSATTLSVSEIAYELGFEHPQSFSKLFTTKINLSPLEFRQSFN